MDNDLYSRRDEVIAERDALVVAMGGLRNYFVATFAEELPLRWDWAERAWFQAHPDVAVDQDLSVLNRQRRELERRARGIANAILAGSTVWAHEGTVDEIWRSRPYSEEAGSRWTHVSDAIVTAVQVVPTLLERQFGVTSDTVSDPAAGFVSPPLAEILKIYAQAFDRLQKVARAISRLNKQIDKAEEEIVSAKRWA